MTNAAVELPTRPSLVKVDPRDRGREMDVSPTMVLVHATLPVQASHPGKAGDGPLIQLPRPIFANPLGDSP
ncbi:hypothetical protein MBT84_40535 [Streptomyces sp. MBT84]|nr:hypothetical protein [Streptomyces sp. MBT84]